MMKWANANPMRMYPMSPNLELDMDKVKIKALYGRHGPLKGNAQERIDYFENHRIHGKSEVLKELGLLGDFEYRNYLFILPNGTKILVWGNDPTVEQLNLCKALQPDIGIIQCSANPEIATKKAEFAAAIGCKVLIPHHHDFTQVDNPANLDVFEKEFFARVPDGRFIRPVHGEWIHL